MRRLPLLLICAWAASLLPASAVKGEAPAAGAKISYQLPRDEPLPRTYRVTLAAVDPKDPNWIISTFASGVVRTVTAENQGRFTESWDGLDENFMPVPAGKYGIRGIFMPGEKWTIDGQYHTIVPKLISSSSSWGQTPAEDAKPNKIEGDPVGSPMRIVDVQPDGKGVVYFQYLENGTNAFQIDLTKPIGYDQISSGYSSGGIGGGSSACTDGRQTWITGDSGSEFILHADGSAFGNQNSLYCHNVYLPTGFVTGLSAWSNPGLGHGILFVSEHGRIGGPEPDRHACGAADDDQIVALDGNNATVLKTWKVERPLSVKVRGGRLYVLHSVRGNFEVISLPLDPNWKQATFSRLFIVPPGIVPFDLEIDSRRCVYLSDPDANHVYQFATGGALMRTYGRLKAQKEGAYDPQTFMSPEKLGCWTDAAGVDRLLVVEAAGPNRLSEWSGEDGRMIRQWVVPQTMANGDYTVDPRHPEMVYVEGQGDVLVRWKMDYGTGKWMTDAVWSNVGSGYGVGDKSGTKLFESLGRPRLVYRGNDLYLTFGSGYAIYHLEGDRWHACAAVVNLKMEDGSHRDYFWRDANDDGRVEPEEYLPYEMSPPPGVFGRFFGDTWFDDLSLVCIGSYSPDIWRLAPTSFDRRGRPTYETDGWRKILTDDVFVGRKAGKATATHGGNELLSAGFDSAWSSVAAGTDGSLYVDARSGRDFSANVGGQFKLSRYDPDGHGGYVQRWRVGRIAHGTARTGEVYGSIFDCPPENGLVGIVDSARAGFEIYTTDGLYVDTLFPDGQAISHDQMGAYWQPGEYFGGSEYVDRSDGKIYLAFGKTMPKIYEAQGWTATQNPVRPLTNLDRTVTLRADEIGTPPPFALQLRGGPAAARVAEFSPMPGGAPALDGSIKGWEGCDPVTFGPDNEQSVEARCGYDREHLFIRWHVRTGRKFEPGRLLPVEQLFAHDRENDTLGLYLQGDPGAVAGASAPGGRAGDVRLIFGIFEDGDSTRPAVLGMYPSWAARGATSMTYHSPVGNVSFAHVGLVANVRAGCAIDGDGRGFVVAAAIPREAIPGAQALNGWRTEGNFDANLGGVNRFWWSDADGSASRETFDEPTEARLYPGSWAPIHFLAIDSLPIQSWMAIGPFGFSGLSKVDEQARRDEVRRKLLDTSYPAEGLQDWAATYTGVAAETRSGTRNLTWKDVETNDGRVDFQDVLGWSGNFEGQNDDAVCFLVTHIYSPAAAEVKLNFVEPDGDHDLSGTLNGAALPETEGRSRIDVAKPLNLKPGWNKLVIRYTYVWGENHLGAGLTADPAVLWKLRISGRGAE